MNVIVVGGIVEKDGKFLLVKENTGRWKGTWNIPAGKLEDHESVIEGAEREFFEETGCKGSVCGLLSILNRVYDDKNIISFVFDMNLIDEDIHSNGLEIEDAAWFSYEELLEMKGKLRADGFYLPTLQKKLEKKILPTNLININRFDKKNS